jgi:hypothetical protein
VQSGEISVASLGTNEAMFIGNLTAIISSGFIHWFWSMVVDVQVYDFSELNKRINLVEADHRGLSKKEQNPAKLNRASGGSKPAVTVLHLLSLWHDQSFLYRQEHSRAVTLRFGY